MLDITLRTSYPMGSAKQELLPPAGWASATPLFQTAFLQGCLSSSWHPAAQLFTLRWVPIDYSLHLHLSPWCPFKPAPLKPLQFVCNCRILGANHSMQPTRPFQEVASAKSCHKGRPNPGECSLAILKLAF